MVNSEIYRHNLIRQVVYKKIDAFSLIDIIIEQQLKLQKLERTIKEIEKNVKN